MHKRWSLRPWARLSGCAALALAVSGCSLISLKSPERPLSATELNARLLTRELAAHFWADVAHVGQDIAASEHDPAVLENSLRWELGAVSESRHAAMQMAPMMSLLDTWALALQMQAFAAEGGAGGALFGAHAAAIRAASDGFAADAQSVAERLLAPREFSEYRNFVDSYVREHPLQDLTFARASVVQLWARKQGADTKLIDSLGTIPEALGDVAQRMQIYSDTVPSQVVRETQLALRESGYSQGDVRSALKQLDERLARLSAVAESTPELVHEVTGEVRQSLRVVLERLDASSRAATEALHTERIALFADLRAEREAVLAAFDEQRKALAVDAAGIAREVVQSAGVQVRYLAGEILLLLIVLAVIVLGLPFAAGYMVGRARARP
jgi:hypothetical protein